MGALEDWVNSQEKSTSPSDLKTNKSNLSPLEMLIEKEEGSYKEEPPVEKKVSTVEKNLSPLELLIEKEEGFSQIEAPVSKTLSPLEAIAYQEDVPLAKAVTKGSKPKEDKQNLFFAVLDQINRPQYAIANTILDAVDNGDFRLGQSLWEGLSLKEKSSIADVLTEVGWRPKSIKGKIAKFSVGLAGDIITDPFTYLGAATISIAGKVPRLIKSGTTAARMIRAGRAAGKAKTTKAVLTAGAFGKKVVLPTPKIFDDAARFMNKTGRLLRDDLPVISDAIDRFRMLSTKMRPKGVDPIAWEKLLIASEKAKNASNALKGEAMDSARAIHKAMREEGITKEMLDEIVNQIERNIVPESKAGKLAVEARDLFQETYKKFGEEGRKIIEEEGVGYLPRVANQIPEKKKIGLGIRDFNNMTPADIKRTIVKFNDGAEEYVLSTESGNLYKNGKIVDSISKDQLKKLDKGKSEIGKISEATIDEIHKGIGEPIFSTNIAELIYIQGQRVAKAKKGDVFFKEMKKNGLKNEAFKKMIEDGRIKNAGDWAESNVPDLMGYRFPKEIVEHIDKTKEIYGSPNKALKIFDNIQRAWKTVNTFWNPAFHTRNAASNTLQNALAGVSNPADYTKGYNIVRKKVIGGKLSPEEAKLLKAFRKQGLDKVGYLSGDDIAKSLDEQILNELELIKKWRPDKALNKFSGRIGDIVEDGAKMAHFIAKKKAGFSDFDAANSVKKYLFDYDDVTDFEKTWLKRGMPFYTFTRKNYPLQLEALIKTPAKQTKFVKVKNNITAQLDDKNPAYNVLEKTYPWLINSVPIYLGERDGKKNYIKLEGFIPAADLEKLPDLRKIKELGLTKGTFAILSDGTRDLLQMATPLLKNPAEQLFNKSFFFGGPLTNQKGLEGFAPLGGGYGERDFFSTRIGGRLDHLVRMFRPISEVEKILPNSTKYSSWSNSEKFFNFLISGKIYQMSEDELLNSFKWKSLDEVRAVKKEMSKLQSYMKKDPSKREAYAEDLKILKKAFMAKQRESREEISRARKSLR